MGKDRCPCCNGEVKDITKSTLFDSRARAIIDPLWKRCLNCGREWTYEEFEKEKTFFRAKPLIDVHPLRRDIKTPVDPAFLDPKRPYGILTPTYLRSSEGLILCRDSRGNLYDVHGSLYRINPMTGKPQKVQYY